MLEEEGKCSSQINTSSPAHPAHIGQDKWQCHFSSSATQANCISWLDLSQTRCGSHPARANPQRCNSSPSVCIRICWAGFWEIFVNRFWAGEDCSWLMAWLMQPWIAKSKVGQPPNLSCSEKCIYTPPCFRGNDNCCCWWDRLTALQRSAHCWGSLQRRFVLDFRNSPLLGIFSDFHNGCKGEAAHRWHN